jgi:hypothetical protein
MKDDMNQKEYSKLKVLIQNDSISTVEG